jgi:hypothetical protein
VVEKHSLLRPEVDGRLAVDQTSPLTITVNNENRAPIVNAQVIVSRTQERLTYRTDEKGQVSLWTTPAITRPYHIVIEKSGFSRTQLDLPVEAITDTVAPPLVVVAPSVTNRPTITITGITERDASVALNEQVLSIDAQGRFTSTVSLNEGSNSLTTVSTDTSANSTVITRTVGLDTVPPSLSIGYPPDTLKTTKDVITVTGTTLGAETVLVSDYRVGLRGGEFLAWALLEDGVNSIVVQAVDKAGNTVTETVRVVRPVSTYLPVIVKNPGNSGGTWSAAGLSGLKIYAVTTDPTDCTTVYVGTADGIYKSTDTGASWSPSGLHGQIATSVVVDPTAPQTVYAATWGEGVYRSRDSGGSWNQVNGGLGSKLFVFPLAIAPDGSGLYAGTYDGGVFKSTDGGSAWSPANNGLGNLNIRSLAVDPGASSVVYAGTTNGVYKSTDHAASWSAASSGISGRTVRALGVHPTSGATVFAGTDAGVYRSSDGGASWAQVGVNGTSVLSLVVDPLEPQQVYAGTDGSGVYKSANGGDAWTEMNAGLGDLTIESLTLDGSACRALQAGTHSGVWGYSE